MKVKATVKTNGDASNAFNKKNKSVEMKNKFAKKKNNSITKQTNNQKDSTLKEKPNKIVQKRKADVDVDNVEELSHKEKKQKLISSDIEPTTKTKKTKNKSKKSDKPKIQINNEPKLISIDNDLVNDKVKRKIELIYSNKYDSKECNTSLRQRITNYTANDDKNVQQKRRALKHFKNRMSKLIKYNNIIESLMNGDMTEDVKKQLRLAVDRVASIESKEKVTKNTIKQLIELKSLIAVASKQNVIDKLGESDSEEEEEEGNEEAESDIEEEETGNEEEDSDIKEEEDDDDDEDAEEESDEVEEEESDEDDEVIGKPEIPKKIVKSAPINIANKKQLMNMDKKNKFANKRKQKK